MELLVTLIIRLYLSVAGYMLRMHSTVITSRMELLILLAALEESSTLREIPVVVMSSENIPTRISGCLEEGAEEFLLKPLRPSDVSRLRNHTNHLGSAS
ncbi:hypothetical protein MRB53_000120 [Persea americana]|uniref:Uncharacterized protein n=2 Tax=Persea americana TaxID=3435 RepID=A0ACC2MMY7_PERAE|nr:hypothetical protein MRB53_000119 [Persea americana]KAJ8647097.1 hypothetical protein MRB53_000120 [Persea americana]